MWCWLLNDIDSILPALPCCLRCVCVQSFHYFTLNPSSLASLTFSVFICACLLCTIFLSSLYYLLCTSVYYLSVLPFFSQFFHSLVYIVCTNTCRAVRERRTKIERERERWCRSCYGNIMEAELRRSVCQFMLDLDQSDT